jgi:hypothetical protein
MAIERFHVCQKCGDKVRGKEGEQKKFGQWAPSMNLSTFEELVTKARSKGYLGSTDGA